MRKLKLKIKKKLHRRPFFSKRKNNRNSYTDHSLDLASSNSIQSSDLYNYSGMPTETDSPSPSAPPAPPGILYQPGSYSSFCTTNPASAPALSEINDGLKGGMSANANTSASTSASTCVTAATSATKTSTATYQGRFVQTYDVCIPNHAVPGQIMAVSVGDTFVRFTCPQNAVPGTNVQICLPVEQSSPEVVQTQTYEITVPDGVQPDQPILTLIQGQTALVTCPPHAVPGSRFVFEMPIVSSSNKSAATPANLGRAAAAVGVAAAATTTATTNKRILPSAAHGTGKDAITFLKNVRSSLAALTLVKIGFSTYIKVKGNILETISIGKVSMLYAKVYAIENACIVFTSERSKAVLIQMLCNIIYSVLGMALGVVAFWAGNKHMLLLKSFLTISFVKICFNARNKLLRIFFDIGTRIRPKRSIIALLIYCFYAVIGILFGVLCFGLAGSLLSSSNSSTEHTINDSLALPPEIVEVEEEVGKIKSLFRFLKKEQRLWKRIKEI